MKTAVRMMTTVSLLTLLAACGGGGAGSVSGGGTSYGALKNSRFVDAPVVGLQYYRSSETSDGLAADDVRTTGANGAFQCLTGETVTFSLNAINGVDLGRITCGADEVFPIDLNTVNGDDQKAQLVALLLHHLADGFDGTNLIDANSTITLSAGAINFMANYDFDISYTSIKGIIGSIRGDYLSIGLLSDADFDNMLLAAQAHLDESEEIVEEANQVGNASVPTEQQLIDYIVANGVEDVQGTHTQYCMDMNDSGDNAYSLFINGTKYAHQDGINAFQVCTITVSNHPSVEVGLTSSVANLESTYVGKFFKKSNGDVRFAQNCPSSDATYANLINGVCDGDAINP